MKKSVKRILSLALVIAVLMTSMLVSSVGAAPAPATDPMQQVLLDALSLNPAGKIAFNAALTKAETDIDGAASDMHTLFTTMSVADAKLALEKYKALGDNQKNLIQASVLLFTLNDVNPSDIAGFSTIAGKVNTELTGSASNNQGISLVIQILKYLNAASKNGAYVTDLSSDISKIAFKYDSSNALVGLAVSSVNSLITSMDTINNKISGRVEADAFGKLLGYTADAINTAPVAEIAALKTYLNNIDDNYYIPYVAPATETTTTETKPVVGTEETKAVDKLVSEAPKADAPVAEINAFEKALDTAVQKAIAAVGTTVVAPTVSGTTATITASQIKVTDFLAKADAVVAKATELAKATVGTNVTVEKKIVIDVATANVDKVNVGLPTELITKVQEKGINTIEIATGAVKINITPDFSAAIKSSASIDLEVNTVTVNDELKATMTEAQKTILAGNATVYDFNFSTVSTEGTKTKVTNFEKSIKIKVKYSLKAGENKDSLTVLFLGDDGKIQNMTGRYNEATGEVEFMTNHFSTYVVKNLVKTFNDVATGAWYKTQAESLASKGIVEGRENNNFKPNANITRAEFMTMLVKAKGVYDQTATCDFADVSKNAWYYTYVASAVNAGIAGGIGDNKFAPNSPITRQEMAVMLANALEVKTLDNASTYLTATDASAIAAYAKNGMALSVKNGFLVGSSNKLDPKGKATRGMAAVVVYKYFNFVN